jgi:PAS domain S-box-containing protein
VCAPGSGVDVSRVSVRVDDDLRERLRIAEDSFRALIDALPDCAVCSLDTAGRVASWNAGGERLFGYAVPEIIGQPYASFFRAAERQAGEPEEHLREARASGRHESQGMRVRRGGAAFDAHTLLIEASPADGSKAGFILVVRDITERIRLEEDLRRRAEQLEAANRAKEEFLATLSHELRTPLNAVLGWARLMRSGRLDEAARTRALDTIERNAHIQEQLIADILDVSRIVTGKLRIELRPIDITPIVMTAVDAVRPVAVAKGVRLEASVEFPGTVMGDPDRLQQVVWNLLSNAIKFTPRGGTVSVSCLRDRAGAVVTVSDTGEGITPELLPFVFDRFRQGDASTTRPHGGLGLGLSIVRHLVELHGGRVDARSEGGGRGAVFVVELPLVLPDAGTLDAVAT